MAEFARVGSIESLRALRAALLAFAEAAGECVVEAEMYVDRALAWLTGEQAAYWKAQRRRRAEEVQRARMALERRRMMPTASGLPPSTVDQEEALAVARRRLAEAERKIEAVKLWARRVEKQRLAFRSSLAPLRGLLEADLPKAAAELDAMAGSLEAYVNLAAPADGVAPERDGAARRTGAPPAGAEQQEEDEPRDQ